MIPLHKRLARKLIFPAVTLAGLERVFTRGTAPGYVILCYHGVDVTSSLPYNGRHLPVKVFEQHLRYYRTHFDVIALSDLHRRVRDDARPKRHTLAVTFDDGYRNNLQQALPLLEQYEMPATVFVVSRILTEPGHLIWTDWLDLLRIKEGRSPDYDEFNTLSRQERDEAIRTLVDANDLRAWKEKVGLTFGDLLNPDELLDLASSPWIDVQAHTHGHFDLVSQDEVSARGELSTCKSLLEEHLQKDIDQLAFPFGRYSQQTLDLAREAGYKAMYSLDYQDASDVSTSDLLPRLNVSGTTTFDSEAIRLHRQWKRYAS